MRAVTEHLLRIGHTPVTALTDYAGVFRGSAVRVKPFARIGADRVAHYVHGKTDPHTTQWQDVCALADTPGAELGFDPGPPRNRRLVDRVRDLAQGRPVVLVHCGRLPMDREDGFGFELLPARSAVCAVLRELCDCYTVQIGKAEQVYRFPVDLDLNGRTTVSDLLDLARYACDAVVAQCSFAIPLAEVFNKPLLAIWSSRAALAHEKFVRLTTPQKVLSGTRDRYVVDNWSTERIREAVIAFCDV